VVRGLAVLLFQGLAASPSLCRSLLGARAVSRSPRTQRRVLSSEKTLAHNSTEHGSVKDFRRIVIMAPYRLPCQYATPSPPSTSRTSSN
jgi:hypothetical protein